ncbi:MAG: DUF1439 domain-containing protein, partial [Planctomycetota bacterium]
SWMPMEIDKEITSGKKIKILANSAQVELEEGSDQIGLVMRIDITLPEIVALPFAKPAVLEKKDLPTLPGFPGPPGSSRGPNPSALTSNSQDDNVDENSKEASSNGSSSEGKKLSGTVSLKTGVRYSSEEAAFYCQNAEVVELTVIDLPENLVPKAKEICEAAINAYCDEKPVYQLADDEGWASMAKANLSEVTIQDGQLQIRLGKGE